MTAAATVIATGSAPITSCPRMRHDPHPDDAVQLKRIPKNLLIVGGGVIGLEFATATRFGAIVLRRAAHRSHQTDLRLTPDIPKSRDKNRATPKSSPGGREHKVKAMIAAVHRNKPASGLARCWSRSAGVR